MSDETEVKQENRLEVIVRDSGLETTKAQYILEKFQGYFQIAADWETQAKSIVVTDVSQVATMKMARVGRLFLRDKRTDIEKARKSLKEQSLREGQTIDSIARILTNLIQPIEKYLEDQEKFAERKAAEEAEQKRKEWEAKLEAERIKAERKAEEERIAKEKADAEERERIRKENERLKREAEEARRKAEEERKEQERKLAEERAKAEAERKRIEEERRKEREAAERKHREIEKKARKEREAAEAARRKAEEEAAAKLEAERREREELERRLAAQVTCPECGAVFIPGEKHQQTSLNLK